MSRTAVKKIPIYDEGVLLTDDMLSIDFTGAGVVGTVLDRNVTETISGGGAGSNYADGITPTGTIDGNNVTFTLPHTPLGVPIITLNGVTQAEGIDYTIVGVTITFMVAPELDPNTGVAPALLAWFRY